MMIRIKKTNKQLSVRCLRKITKSDLLPLPAKGMKPVASGNICEMSSSGSSASMGSSALLRLGSWSQELKSKPRKSVNKNRRCDILVRKSELD